MKKTFTLSLIAILFSLASVAQQTGDTIEVATINYTQTSSAMGRDTMVQFPDISGITFEKILMSYNMRCKDGLVSPPVTGQTNIGCGEWDYSCNTYITDSSRVDSLLSYHASHIISGYSGSSFDYVLSPLNDFYRIIQPNVVVNSTTSETSSTVGTGTQTNLLQANTAKIHYLFTQSELSSAGLTTGDIDAMSFNLNSTLGNHNYLRIKLMHTSKTTLDAKSPDLIGLTEVYYHHSTLSSGTNRLQFYTPFNWNGTDNIIMEISYSSLQSAPVLDIASHTSTGNGIYSVDDETMEFNGSNYFEAQNYKGIPGSENRTVEAWIKTYTADKEIVSWGKNSTSNKWVFRINGDGTIRTEINGGYKYGTTNVCDGQWHHVAIVLDGTTVNDFDLYVDGVLETVGAVSSITVNTDTSSGINVRVTKGHHNKYFYGNIDEVRIWDTALSSSTLVDYMHQKVDANHPNHANLKLYYSGSSATANQVDDLSGNNYHANIINGSNWQKIIGDELFKEVEATNQRPNTTFMQGVYSLTITNDTLMDSIQRTPRLVQEYVIANNWGSTLHDDVVVDSSYSVWDDSDEVIYDENGTVLSVIPVSADGTITISELNYYRRYASKYEIMSFVTPYGINLDMGPDGKTWYFDVTDFAPILKGWKRMTIERGGQRQEDMDIRFHFIVGTPPQDVLDINQIWRVDKPSYTSILNDRIYEPRTINTLSNAAKFKVRSVITGHGQEGEFIPRLHHINIDGGSEEFVFDVWTECAENPVYPQGGTWIYDRAGWCPGMPSDIREFDATPYVTSGQPTTIDYGMNTASGSSTYIINNQFVSYGAPNHSLDARVLEILSPTDRVEFERWNYICSDPEIIIQNTGSTPLTSLDIKYWVNNDPNPQTLTWTGNLAFLESETVQLPYNLDLWAPVVNATNQFNVKVESPNGGSDEYSYNDQLSSDFEITPIHPSRFYIMFKTNNLGGESSYKLFDDTGKSIFTRSGMSSNTIYRDTFDLHIGCYQLRVYDNDDDGIDFWANNDGSGYVRLMPLYTGWPMKVFEPDFGDGFIYNFTVEKPLSLEDDNSDNEIKLYPNPSDGFIQILLPSHQEEVYVEFFDARGNQIKSKVHYNVGELSYDLKDYEPGSYFVRIRTSETIQSIPFIIQP